MSTLSDHERLALAVALLRRGAWAIARDLRVGSAKLRTCNACGVSYLVSSASRLAPIGPFCALYARLGGGPETPYLRNFLARRQRTGRSQRDSLSPLLP